jgi:pSer/pThr/pTyr-binding forkhead associated (FHA) protein
VEAAVRAGRPRVVGVVVAVEGEFEGRAFPLFEGVNRIGREHTCEICLPSERVAPQHVCIEYRAGFFRLERIAEPEVRVNFEPVAGSLLRDGDAIQLGMTTFRFRSIVGA